MKQLLEIRRNFEPHWVGDGFPVRSLFSYNRDTDVHDPFLLLDYAAPFEFPSGAAPRGVGEHPHRGFETVTIVYQGELEHGDSAGNRGKIGPGDVQWMTAASGVVHQEFHSEAFTRSGGTFEVAQLWVNLPAQQKMSPPRYQEIRDRDIPRVNLKSDAGSARVIAGEFAGVRGPAQTVTPILVCDLEFTTGRSTQLGLPSGFTTMLVVQGGELRLNGADTARGVELALFDRSGDQIAIECAEESRALLLCGKPIGEPVVGQGPFVMNTREEIRQAMIDYQSGRMGSLA
ncbi:MAG TPA: pirin family protein [Lacipirellulaceae bacterium]|nr:pirin family protein [Lacipirellulaceae bacterium]